MKVENLEHIQKIRDAEGLNSWDNMDNMRMSRKVQTIRRVVIHMTGSFLTTWATISYSRMCSKVSVNSL